MENEIWKDIPGFEGIYKINKKGEVKSLNRIKRGKGGSTIVVKEKILKQSLDRKNGYLMVTLTKNEKRKNYRIHKLVANLFIPNPNNYPQVNHIDGNKFNNTVDNLEWCTPQENIQHAWKNGLNYISEKHKTIASQTAKERWKKYRNQKNINIGDCYQCSKE